MSYCHIADKCNFVGLYGAIQIPGRRGEIMGRSWGYQGGGVFFETTKIEYEKFT